MTMDDKSAKGDAASERKERNYNKLREIILINNRLRKCGYHFVEIYCF